MTVAKETLRQFIADKHAHARHCLKVRPKDAVDKGLVPLVFNKAQEHIDAQLDAQLRETSRVRALVLKGRQQGASTYVGARFYRKATLWRNVNVYILSHEQKSADALFDMVERYQANNPIAPAVGVSNVKELEFPRLGSTYAVATAGQRAGGRGRTITLFHGSEVAFWTNASDHFASSVQAVPDAAGTEIILESTANGTSGEFYERWQDAEAGRGDYIAIFVPWYWQTEYRRAVPEGFELGSEPEEEGGLSEAEVAEMFGLDNEQMAWRRAKIAELRSLTVFKQEYPCTSQEAFQTTGVDSFIKAAAVLRARKRKDVVASGPLVMGVDPASGGGDRFAVCFRRGHVVEHLDYRDKIEAPEAVAWLDDLIQKWEPDLVNIDAGSIGRAIISQLKALPDRPDYARLVKSINFGGTADAKMVNPKRPSYRNKRAEMWDRMREWLLLEEGVSVPDLDELQGDLTAPQKKPDMTFRNDLLLESKAEMRARGVRSPDLADSLCLTFASMRHIPRWKSGTKEVSVAAVREGEARPQRVLTEQEAFGNTGGHYGWMG